MPAVRGGSVAGYRTVVITVYSGPGDIVPSAVGWWGLRAYTLAGIGGNAIRLRRDSDNAEQDFITIAGGGIDLTSIASFQGAANLFVVKLYDQTGNGHDLSQSTAANQPGFSATTVSFASASAQVMASTGFVQNQPLSLVTVTKYVNNSAQAALIGGVTTGSLQLGYNPSGANANKIFLYAGASVPTVAATDGSFHSIIAIYDDAVSSQGVVDGTSSSVSLGSTNGFPVVPPNALALGNDNAGTGSTPFNGNVQELGLWSFAFTGAQQTAMNSNQHAYWGF